MIDGLPRASDLVDAGVDYLYMALSDAIAIVRDEREFVSTGQHGFDDEEKAEFVRDYWLSVRRRLAKGASLLQTGTELLLKAKVADVSPYALLDCVSRWPKRASKEDSYFDEFRTVDARDLPQVVNTLCADRLSSEFLTTFEGIRKRRNAIVHAASDRAVPTCESLVRDVLVVVANLVGEGRWPELHRQQAHATPFSRIDHYSTIEYRLLHDFDFLLSLLSHSEGVRHLGFGKRQRRYLCPSCRFGKFAPDIRAAFLAPNSPRARAVKCIACGGVHSVSRHSCSSCRGNVMDEDDVCLSCGGENSR